MATTPHSDTVGITLGRGLQRTFEQSTPSPRYARLAEVQASRVSPSRQRPTLSQQAPVGGARHALRERSVESPDRRPPGLEPHPAPPWPSPQGAGKIILTPFLPRADKRAFAIS